MGVFWGDGRIVDNMRMGVDNCGISFVFRALMPFYPLKIEAVQKTETTTSVVSSVFQL